MQQQTDFPVSSRNDWRDMVSAGLRGAEFETLIHTTEDGLPRGPLMCAADLPPALARLARVGAPKLDGRPWHITTLVRDADIGFANQQWLDDLKGGASAARLSLGEDGLNIRHRNDMKRLLDRVLTDLVPLSLAPHSDLGVVDKLTDLTQASVNLGLSPLSDGLPELITTLPQSWRAVTIDAAAVHEAGGTDVLELAVFAGHAASLYRRLGADTSAQHIGVEITTDQDAHLSIAKLRALRRIYASVAKAFDADDVSLSVHAITSLRMMQSVDPWTNLLRIMSAGFGAVAGGADFVTTRPFTDANGGATPFAHRIARNMQIMMMEESQLGQVLDPAFGSYWHENLTDKLAEAAWTKFQEIEAIGGIETYLSNGQYNADIEAATAARAERDAPILGVSLHPAKDVTMPELRK